MNGETMPALSPHEQYPGAVDWLIKLIQNSSPPSALREDFDKLRLYLIAYLGAPPSIEDLFRQPVLSDHHAKSTCPTCGQEAIVDASNEECPVCTGSMRISATGRVVIFFLVAMAIRVVVEQLTCRLSCCARQTRLGADSKWPPKNCGTSK